MTLYGSQSLSNLNSYKEVSYDFISPHIVRRFQRLSEKENVIHVAEDIRKWMLMLKEKDLAALGFILCMENPVISDLRKDIRTRVFANLKYPKFFKETMKTASRRIKSIIGDFTTVERCDLINIAKIAHFLGIISFHCDVPLLIEDLDWEKLLEDAYNTDAFNHVMIGFVHFLKPLEYARSTVFTPHSSWGQALIKLLHKYNSDPDVQLSLRTRVLMEDYNILFKWGAHELDEEGLSNKRFYSMLDKYNHDVKCLLKCLPDSILGHPLYKIFNDLANRVKDFCSFTSLTTWEKMISDSCFDYVCSYYSNHSNELEFLNLRNFYQRSLMYLIGILTRKMEAPTVSKVIGIALSKGAIAGVFSMSSFKDILRCDDIDTDEFDQAFSSSLKELIIENDDAFDVLSSLAKKFNDYRTFIWLPLTFDLFVDYDMIGKRSCSSLLAIKTHLTAEEKIAELNEYLTTIGRHADAETFLVKLALPDYHCSDESYLICKLAYHEAVKYFDGDLPDYVSSEMILIYRQYVADAWAILAYHLFALHEPTIISRVVFLRTLLNILIEELFRNNEVVGLYLLHFRSIATLMRLVLQSTDDDMDKDVYLHFYLDILYELQPLIVPASVNQWHGLMESRICMVDMMMNKDDIALRYLKCLFTYFEFINEAYALKIADSITASVNTAVLETVIALCSKNPRIFADYHYLFVPMIPMAFSFIRKIFLLAGNQERTVSKLSQLTLLTFLQLPESREHPAYHGRLLPILPEKLQLALKGIPHCQNFDEIATLIVNFLTMNPCNEGTYNYSAMYGLLISTASSGIDFILDKGLEITPQQVALTKYPKLYHHIITHLCPKGRMLFFNAILEQLRCADTHTSFFVCAIVVIYTGNSQYKEAIANRIFKQMACCGPDRIGLDVVSYELATNYGLLETDTLSTGIAKKFRDLMKTRVVQYTLEQQKLQLSSRSSSQA